MFYKNLPISILSEIHDLSVRTLIVESRSTNIVDVLSKFNISVSTSFLEKIKNRDNKTKTFVFYPEKQEIFEIICFFPHEETLSDDRAEIFQKYKNNVAYLPDGDEVNAFENFSLSIYEFTKYKTKKDEEKKIFILENVDLEKWMSDKIELIKAIYFARDLVNMPPQDLNPESFVKIIQEKKWRHFDVEIFWDSQLRELGCNLIRAVGQWSVRESFMVILKPKKLLDAPKIGLIGKGVTFDAGWIQIKPDKAMLDMKCDMAGAAGMLGVALYLDSLETLPVNVIIGLGLVENMTGSAAFKPLDIYKSYNGITVEIHHTDAEGRLVLADVMSYVEKNFQTQHLVTMATLTGACLYALGNNISGIMGDDENLISTFIDNTSTYEPVWRLPMTKQNKEALRSDIADIKNLADGEYMESSVAGAFLSYFQGNAKLTHLDIAGPAYRTKTFGHMPIGWTGWWVKKISEVLIKSFVS